MTKKKPGFIERIFLWAAAIIVLCGIGLLMWPNPAPRHQPISVKVEQPPEAPKEAETPPVGDEKAQPQAASIPAPTITPPAAGGKPMIAIVIDDMGLDLKGSKRAAELPGYVTLSFMPYATRLREQTREAREEGHELLLHMPMEPMGHDDPGPGALLVGLPPDELRQRFETALASFVGFDGVNNHMGSKFTADPAGMEIVIDELQQRNLFFLDSRTNAKTVGESTARQHGLPTIARDVFLDDDINLPAVNTQLERTEYVARRKGYAVAIGHPHAITLQALEAWLPAAEKRGFVFVPVKNLVSSHAE
jgi:polysaccharide deacetylase 2 family uncharacterized protein YibQ